MPPLAILNGTRHEEIEDPPSCNCWTDMLFDMILEQGCFSPITDTTKSRTSIHDVFRELDIPMTIPVSMELKEPSRPPSSRGDFCQDIARPMLARPTYVRSKLAEWLPFSLKFNKLDLLYSTSHHGRSLESLYNKVGSAQHTIMLLEPMDGSTMVGMYASHPWHKSRNAYGDGRSFFFRIDEYAPHLTQCWHWHQPNHCCLSCEDISIAEISLLEQFQVSTNNFLSMGGNKDGSSGLRLNNDLTIAESAPAVGFDNLPLAGDLFEVGLLEVYQITSF
jgi:hypothetical protein